MPVLEIHHKMTVVNALTIQQILFEDMRVCQTLHGCKFVRGPTSIRPRTQLHTSLQNPFHCWAVATGQEVAKAHCCSKSNCKGSRPHSRIMHYEGDVSLSSGKNTEKEFQHCQQPLLDRIVHLFALSKEGGSLDGLTPWQWYISKQKLRKSESNDLTCIVLESKRHLNYRMPLIHIHENTTSNTPPITNRVLFLQRAFESSFCSEGVICRVKAMEAWLSPWLRLLQYETSLSYTYDVLGEQHWCLL